MVRQEEEEEKGVRKVSEKVTVLEMASGFGYRQLEIMDDEKLVIVKNDEIGVLDIKNDSFKMIYQHSNPIE